MGNLAAQLRLWCARTQTQPDLMLAYYRRRWW
jgi:hypothetical protein